MNVEAILSNCDNAIENEFDNFDEKITNDN